MGEALITLLEADDKLKVRQKEIRVGLTKYKEALIQAAEAHDVEPGTVMYTDPARNRIVRYALRKKTETLNNAYLEGKLSNYMLASMGLSGAVGATHATALAKLVFDDREVTQLGTIKTESSVTKSGKRRRL